MTSPDGSGPAGGEEPAARGQEPDHDPVRLRPPADPWLTEAPTSALGPGLPPAVPADTQPYGGPPADWEEGPPRRRNRRRAVVVIAVCVLLVAGALAFDSFGSDDDGSARGPDPSTTPARPSPTTGATTRPQPGIPANANKSASASAKTSASPGTPMVIYEVTASGSRNRGSVVYTDQDGEFIRLHGVALPWRKAVPVGARRKPLVLDAQRKDGGDAGPVTCTITVGGKLLSSTTATGRYASAQCVASG